MPWYRPEENHKEQGKKNFSPGKISPRRMWEKFTEALNNLFSTIGDWFWNIYSEFIRALLKQGQTRISESPASFSKDSSVQSAREAASYTNSVGYAASLADLTKIPGTVSTQIRGLKSDGVAKQTNRTSGIRTEQENQGREEQP